MKTRILLVLLLLANCGYAVAEYSEIYIHGEPVTCTASDGQTVLFYDHPAAAHAARQRGGARADFSPQFGYTIAFDPQFMNSLPFLAAIFVVAHECAHVALPMGVGLASHYQEKNADCWAVQAMTALGYLTSWNDFTEAMSAVVASGGGHAVNQQRISAAAQCL